MLFGGSHSRPERVRSVDPMGTIDLRQEGERAHASALTEDGSGRLSMVEDFLLSSVTSHVLAGSNCNVLVVHDRR
jgi:nucleotide-binding universal stress UspA family protein